MATEFTATFTSSPAPPTSNQFPLATEDDPSHDNLFTVSDTTEVKITLTGDASFFITGSPGPIVWSLPPDSGEPNYAVSGSSNNILTFIVPEPPHVLHPWVFRFVVNVSDEPSNPVVVRSQNIYIAKPLGTDPRDYLQYSTTNGNFALVPNLSSPQVGVNLGEELVLVNVHGSRSFSVNLVSDPPVTPPTPAPLFEPPGIYWSSDPALSGISFTPIELPTSTLSFTTDSSAMGHSISLQFAIVVTNSTTGESTTVLSPDPIIINST